MIRRICSCNPEKYRVCLRFCLAFVVSFCVVQTVPGYAASTSTGSKVEIQEEQRPAASQPHENTQQTPRQGTQAPGQQEAQQAPSQDPYSNYNNGYNGYYNGDNGYIGTYRDKETGDTITTIIAPRPPQVPQQNPMVIVPHVGDGYSNSPGYPSYPAYPNYPGYPGYPHYPGYPGYPANPGYPPVVDPGFSRPHYPGGGIPPTWWRGAGQR